MSIIEVDYKENAGNIANLLDAYTRVQAPEAIETPRKKLSFALVIDGDIVSRITGSISFNGLHIELFMSSNQARGKGYGSQLFAHIEKIAIENGCHYMVLETMSFNAPKFYLDRGFDIIKKVDDSPIDGEKMYFMFKSLR